MTTAPRIAAIDRATRETRISGRLALDGAGEVAGRHRDRLPRPHAHRARLPRRLGPRARVPRRPRGRRPPHRRGLRPGAGRGARSRPRRPRRHRPLRRRPTRPSTRRWRGRSSICRAGRGPRFDLGLSREAARWPGVARTSPTSSSPSPWRRVRPPRRCAARRQRPPPGRGRVQGDGAGAAPGDARTRRRAACRSTKGSLAGLAHERGRPGPHRHRQPRLGGGRLPPGRLRRCEISQSADDAATAAAPWSCPGSAPSARWPEAHRRARSAGAARRSDPRRTADPGDLPRPAAARRRQRGEPRRRRVSASSTRRSPLSPTAFARAAARLEPGRRRRRLPAARGRRGLLRQQLRLDAIPDGWQRRAWTDHGGAFVAAIERGAVLACQFHPELSGAWGAAAGWSAGCHAGSRRCCCRGSSPVSTSATAGSSRASSSRVCATPATRSSSPRPTRSRAPTSSSCSMSAPPPRAAATPSRSCAPCASVLAMPLTVGGGVRAVADAEALLEAGADKVATNTAAVARPDAARPSSPSASAASARCSPSTPRRERRRLGGGACARAATEPAATPSPGPPRRCGAAPARSC